MRRKLLEAMVVGLITGLALGIVFYWQEREEGVKVVFCDVGQGDGALVEEGNWQMIIDTGFDNGKMLKCLSEKMPWEDKTIEVVMVSHWDSDHSGALTSLMKYYKLEKLIYSQEPEVSIEQKVEKLKWAKGNYLLRGKIYFEVLSPEENGDNSNDGSLVGVLKYRNKENREIKILFTGDASEKVEQRLVWRGVLKEEVDVLKVSHHGSEEATSKELLGRIRPLTAVISVGNNKFGHPGKGVLERLTRVGAVIYRTDINGDVAVE